MLFVFSSVFSITVYGNWMVAQRRNGLTNNSEHFGFYFKVRIERCGLFFAGLSGLIVKMRLEMKRYEE